MVVDTFTRWPEVELTKSITANTTIKLRTTEHIRTAPYHPQSNGLVEPFVDIVKRSVNKIRSGGESIEDSLQTFLTVYRSTPTHDLGGQSLAQKMLG